jgi:hypothetical protein
MYELLFREFLSIFSELKNINFRKFNRKPLDEGGLNDKIEELRVESFSNENENDNFREYIYI